MASNFKILVHKTSDCAHIKLLGDFDGTSACELLDAIKENADKIGKVVINTNGLRRVYPFGRNVFHTNLSVSRLNTSNLHFTGRSRVDLTLENGSGS